MYTPRSNHKATSIYTQESFLEEISKKLEHPEQTKTLIADFEDFRQAILNPNYFYLHVASDLEKLTNAKSSLQSFLPSELKKFQKTESKNVHYSSSFRQNSTASEIYGIASIENSYLFQVGSGIASYDHTDIASLMVLNEYLSGMEGPFWNEIRGAGLAYGYGLFSRIEEGYLGFSLSKSSNVVDAYERAKDIVKFDLFTRFSFSFQFFHPGISN